MYGDFAGKIFINEMNEYCYFQINKFTLNQMCDVDVYLVVMWKHFFYELKDGKTEHSIAKPSLRCME